MSNINEDIDYLFSKINWGSSFLDAKAIDIMNTLKSKIEEDKAELKAVADEAIKVWNEDGEAGEIQMKTPIAWYRVLRLAEKINKKEDAENQETEKKESEV